MKQSIIVNGKPFYYEGESLTHETITPIIEEDGRFILETTKKLFNDVGLEPILAFGTLLGAVRDHGIIKGDEDVDVFCDNEAKFLDSLSYFRENGLELIRASSGVLYSFRLNNRCYIDVYIITKFKFSVWGLYCNKVYGRAMPKKFFRNYNRMEFLGKEYSIPNDAENLLAFWYGKTWRVPVRGHKFFYEVKSRYYWKHNIRPLIMELMLYPIWRTFLSSKFNSISESIKDWNLYKASLK